MTILDTKTSRVTNYQLNIVHSFRLLSDMRAGGKKVRLKVKGKEKTLGTRLIPTVKYIVWQIKS